MEVKNSFDELEIFIEEYKNRINNFCEKMGIDREDLQEFLKDKSQEISTRIKNIDANISKKGEFTQFHEIEDYDREIFAALVGEKDLDVDNVDFSEIEDAQKEYNKLYLERESANYIIESKDAEEIPENISPEVKEIFDRQQQLLNELSNIDPDTAVKKMLNRKYPEIAEIIGDKIDLPDLYKRIDNLPDNISAEIRDMFGEEYQGFINEVQKRGEEKQQELDEKVKEYDKEFNNDIYEKYKSLTDIQKEELLKYSDGEISSKIIRELSKEVENAKENIQFSPVYNSYFDYREKKELMEKDENTIISNKIEEVISDKIDIELDRMSEIRSNVMPYFGKKKDLEDVNDSISKCNDLKGYLAPYLKSENVKKSLNNMTDQKVNELREKALIANIDIRKVMAGISTSLESSYKEELEVCGNKILEMSNYETEDSFTSFLQNAYDDQMREDMMSIAKYRNDQQENIDMDIIRYAYENETKYSKKELDEILSFCKFKYSSIECRLKENASLSNVKVVDSDEIGLKKFLNVADRVAYNQIEANRKILDIKEDRLKSQARQFLRLEPKKEQALSLREKMLNERKIEDEGLVYGG